MASLPSWSSILLVIVTLRFATPAEINLHTGIQHVELRDARLYRGYIYVHYLIEFPKVTQQNFDLNRSLRDCNHTLNGRIDELESADSKLRQTSQLCHYLLTMKTLEDESLRLITSLTGNREDKQRSKRSLINILAWIGESIFGSGDDSEAEKIRTSEAKLAERIRFLRFVEETRTEQEKKDINEIKTWSEQVNNALSDISKHTFNAELSLLNKEQTLGKVTSFLMIMVSSSLSKQVAIVQLLKEREILNDCESNRIPVQAVNFTWFESDLDKLSQTLAKDNLKLSIDKSDKLAYLNEKLAVCKFSGTRLHLQIGVPVVFDGDADMKVLSVVPLNFLWKNEQCTLMPQAILGTWSPSQKIFSVFKDESSKKCLTTKLCRIPRIPVVDMCISKLLSGNDVQNVKQFCSFVCDSNNLRTRAVQIAENEFSVTTLSPNLTLNCSGSTRDISVPNAGALKVTITCNCSLHDGSHEVVSRSVPCEGETQTSVNEIVLPALWSEERVGTFSLNGSHNLLRLFRGNASDVINEQWKGEVKHLNLHKPSTLPTDSIDWRDDFTFYASHVGVGGSTLLMVILLFFGLKAIYRRMCASKLATPRIVSQRGTSGEYEVVELRPR